MPQNAEKKSSPVLVNLAPTTYLELKRITEIEDRPMGYIVRELMLRGLRFYRSDAQLRDPSSPHNAEEAVHEGIKRAIPRDIGVKASKVIARIEPGLDPKAEVRRMITADEEASIARQLKPRKRKTG